MHGCCDILRRSPEGRRAWDAFISQLEQGTETPEEMVQAEEVCLIQAEGGISHQLCELLQLCGQGHQDGVDVIFRDVLSLCQLVEMVLQVP